MTRARRLIGFTVSALVAAHLLAAPGRSSPVAAALVAESAAIEAGRPFVVGVRLDIGPGWHIYGRDAGETGLPTGIAWDLPPGYSAGELSWPEPDTFSTGSLTSQGYSGTVLLIATVTPPASQPSDPSISIRARATWLACSDQCMPGSADLALEIPVGRLEAADPAVTALFAMARSRLAHPPGDPAATGSTAVFGTLLSAFIGGLILNLMPCVFPVLGIKIMGFVHQSGAERRRVTTHGLVFAAGVLVSFWLLAGVLLALRAGGERLGWGFQLQSPAFVYCLAAFLLVFGLNMSGVFEFGLAATGVGSSLQSRAGYTGSFFTGVLVTVVSTPCAAPFLAPALGAALALPAAQSFVLFTAIAAGLALPYLILSFFPALVKLLPRPGAWMESFKQIMAFPLYATVAGLVWVLAGQLDADALFASLLSLVLLAMAVWAYGRWGQHGASASRRRLGAVLAAIALVTGLALGLPRGGSGDIAWHTWSPEFVEDQRTSGNVIYVDFTARWCATCKVNKLAVFSSAEVARSFEEHAVVAVRADWTSRDPAITHALAGFGRSAVPFNLVYGPGVREPIILPEVLTPGIVLDAIARASRPAVGALDAR